MRGSDLSPQTFGRSLKSAALSADDEESQNHQHNVRDEHAGYGWRYSTLSNSAKTSFFLPSCLSSGSAISATTPSSSILS
jgi:hypothetical protein